jgi:hypothetical protein
MTRIEAAQLPVRRARTGAGARLNADHIWIYRLVVAGVMASALAAIISSWSGLLFVASWWTLPNDLRWVLPLGIDVPIFTFAIGALALRSRGDRWQAVGFTVVALVFTAASATANFAHVASVRGLHDYTDWIGASGSAAMPLITMITTEALGQLVTRPKREPSASVKLKTENRKLKGELRRLKAGGA